MLQKNSPRNIPVRWDKASSILCPKPVLRSKCSQFTYCKQHNNGV